MESKTSQKEPALNLGESVTASGENSLLILQKTTNQHVLDIQKSLESFQNTSNNDTKALATAVEGVCQAIQEQGKLIKEQGTALHNEIQKADKIRRIEFGIQQVAHVSKGFEYKRATKFTEESSEWREGIRYTVSQNMAGESLIVDILFSFRKGVGYYVDNCVIDNDNSTFQRRGEIEKDSQSFRDTLSDKLHSLLGKKPRMALSNGRMCVFYE